MSDPEYIGRIARSIAPCGLVCALCGKPSCKGCRESTDAELSCLCRQRTCCREKGFVIERLNREIRRRTRVVGTFPDGNSALMLVCARLRHVAGTQWGNKKYMNMKHLEAALEVVSIAG